MTVGGNTFTHHAGGRPVCPDDFADISERRIRRQHQQRDRHCRHRLRVDRDRERDLDHDRVGRERLRQRLGQLHRHRESIDHAARAAADHRRQYVQCDAGGRTVRADDRAGVGQRRRGRGHRDRHGHGGDRLRVDDDQQRRAGSPSAPAPPAPATARSPTPSPRIRPRRARTATLTIGGNTFTVTQAGAPVRADDRAGVGQRRRGRGHRDRHGHGRPPAARGPRRATPAGSPSVPAHRHRQRLGHLQRHRESDHDRAHGDADDRRQHLHRHAGWLHRARRRFHRARRTSRRAAAPAPCLRHCRDRLRVDRHQQCGMDHDLATGATGNGNGSVTYNVAANTATTPRTGTLTIAGNTFTVTQAGAPCAATISPVSVNAYSPERQTSSPSQHRSGAVGPRQQPGLDHDHRRHVRQRQWLGHLHSGGQSDHDLSHWNGDRRQQHLHRDAGGSTLCADDCRSLGERPVRCEHRHRGCDRRDRVCVDRDGNRNVGFNHRWCKRNRYRVGQLQRHRQPLHDAEIRDDHHRWQQLHH